jgi:hypothetical protein
MPTTPGPLDSKSCFARWLYCNTAELFRSAYAVGYGTGVVEAQMNLPPGLSAFVASVKAASRFLTSVKDRPTRSVSQEQADTDTGSSFWVSETIDGVCNGRTLLRWHKFGEINVVEATVNCMTQNQAMSD